MIKPALLYADQLQKKVIESWYEPETRFYSGLGSGKIELVDNNYDERQYVSIGKDGNVIGYISHNVDWCTRSASHWLMTSFDKGNLEFVRDLHKVVTDLFFKENFNRVEWWCFADNPAVRGYKNFIKRFGGSIVGELHKSAVFSDGTVHDTYIFEILRENVHNLY